MNNQDPHKDLIEGTDITFAVETTESIGEPVFSIELDGSTQSPESQDSQLFDSGTTDSDPGLNVEEAFLDHPDEDPTEGVVEADDTLREDLTLAGKIEAIIFASPKPLRAVEISELLVEQGHTLKEVQDKCDELVEYYRDRASGFHLKYIKRMGYQFQTTTAAKSLMEKQFSSRPRPLSRAALETLAVIAYRQKLAKGVTRAEVEFIRGVDAGSIFKTLVERNLLTCVGRKEIPGRPMMFGVTDEFLKVFQLGSINDLPPLESFQTPADVIASANQKIADFEAEQEGIETNQFISDEEYRDEVEGEQEFNPLASNAPIFAPIIAERIENQLSAGTNASETLVSEHIDQLFDEMDEGQVAWAMPEVHTDLRPVEGATSAPQNDFEGPSTNSIDEILDHERNETSEVDFTTGDSKSTRGGDLDQ